MIDFSVTVLQDSLAPNGIRLTSVEAVFPSILLREVNTHRMMSRNTASSRAIPVNKMISRVLESPFIPEYFGRNQTGMSAAENLEGDEAVAARTAWLQARDNAVAQAEELLSIGVHKQLANRLLEPFSWTTAIWSATDWSNMIALRNHADAQPEFQKITQLLQTALETNTPTNMAMGEWHLPLVSDEERATVPIEELCKISAGRCARVSYLTHAGERDLQADITLYDRLLSGGHLSPLEHVATPLADREYLGNFCGWQQLRKMIDHEDDFSRIVHAA